MAKITPEGTQQQGKYGVDRPLQMPRGQRTPRVWGVGRRLLKVSGMYHKKGVECEEWSGSMA